MTHGTDKVDPISSPENHPIPVGTAVLCDPRSNVVGVVRRAEREGVSLAGVWEFFGGKLNSVSDDGHASAIAREVCEEGGVSDLKLLVPLQFDGDYAVKRAPAKRDLLVYRYLAMLAKRPRIHLKEPEFHDQFTWVGTDDYSLHTYVPGVKEYLDGIFGIVRKRGTILDCLPISSMDVNLVLVDPSAQVLCSKDPDAFTGTLGAREHIDQWVKAHLTTLYGVEMLERTQARIGILQAGVRKVDKVFQGKLKLAVQVDSLSVNTPVPMPSDAGFFWQSLQVDALERIRGEIGSTRLSLLRSMGKKFATYPTNEAMIKIAPRVVDFASIRRSK